MRRSGLVLLVVALAAALGACHGGDDPEPKATSVSSTSPAVTEFAQAYATFQTDLAAAKAIADKHGLQNAITSVRAVRGAYFDLDTATRKIDMPPVVADDVTAMLGAIGDLIAALDRQGGANTTDDFDAAAVASRDAMRQADDAIQVVVDGLGAGSDAAPGIGNNGSTKQRRIRTTYASGPRITDADKWVTDLLEVGAVNVNHLTPAEDMGVVVAWRAAFPQVLTQSRVVGSAEKAPKNGISGFSVLIKNDKNPAGSGNPFYLAFAVRDDHGTCAGGVLSGYPDPTKRREVDPAGSKPCTADAVAQAAGY
jgi:hypothetical protein